MLGLASKIVLSLERIQSSLVTKSSHISDTHGESTQVSIYWMEGDRTWPVCLGLVSMDQCISTANATGYLCLINPSGTIPRTIETGLGGF